MPTTRKELQSFLGLVNYCRRFIPDLATKATFLYRQINNSISKKYGQDEKFIKSFMSVKNSISSNVLLSIPDINEQFILTSDASNIRHGGGFGTGSLRSPHVKNSFFANKKLGLKNIGNK